MTKLTVFQEEISAFCGEMELRFDEPMAKHTSFHIGGGAEVMVFPKTTEELSKVLIVSKQLDCKPAILGAGTNVLAPDQGIPGLVICLKGCLDGLELLEDNRIRVMAGVTMARAAVYAADMNLGGMEFAHGIPGTIGGGVYMNAGAYGGEMADIVESVEVMDREGNLRVLSNQQMQFSYRHSILEETDDIVISAVLRLQPCPMETVTGKMKELIARRTASQPLDLPSAGSAFKRPVGGYAAALIDQAGMKGYQVGGAAISTKHAGFAVNLGGATAADVKQLLRQVSDRVFETSGIRIEPEIRIW
ncbi:MAG: UDP-N-acetylmuramate dehydrogenase [Faecousia sp.]